MPFAGKGIPSDLRGQGCLSRITEDFLPVGQVAADLYEQERGTSLKRESVFAVDPFPND